MTPSSSKVPVEQGIPQWQRAAVSVLTEAATEYNRVLTVNEFADELQRRTGAWANVTSKTWVRKVLEHVTHTCTEEGWPHLASLVVRPSDGKPGPWYLDVISRTGRGQARDDVAHAAEQRLACYTHFGADVPAGAGPTADPLRLRRRVHNLDAPARPKRRPRSTRPKPVSAKAPPKREARGRVCPTCFMEMPATGVCHNCH